MAKVIKRVVVDLVCENNLVDAPYVKDWWIAGQVKKAVSNYVKEINSRISDITVSVGSSSTLETVYPDSDNREPIDEKNAELKRQGKNYLFIART